VSRGKRLATVPTRAETALPQEHSWLQVHRIQVALTFRKCLCALRASTKSGTELFEILEHRILSAYLALRGQLALQLGVQLRRFFGHVQRLAVHLVAGVSLQRVAKAAGGQGEELLRFVAVCRQEALRWHKRGQCVRWRSRTYEVMDSKRGVHTSWQKPDAMCLLMDLLDGSEAAAHKLSQKHLGRVCVAEAPLGVMPGAVDRNALLELLHSLQDTGGQ